VDEISTTAACPACGETLVAQGYCPVCEDFWPLAVGVSCPKHDISLESKPPPGPRMDLKQQDFRWVTVSRFSDSQSAHAPRIRLEAEGIPTFLEGERMGSRSMYAVATGGAKLKVPEHLAGEARIILSQTWTATAAALGIEESPDDDELDFDPKPEAEPPAQDAGEEISLRSGLLFFVLVGLPSALLLFLLLRWMSAQP
jgi:hypothetical protein